MFGEGPLVAEHPSSGQWYVGGLLAGGNRDCGRKPLFPSIFTKVESHLDWIKEKMTRTGTNHIDFYCFIENPDLYYAFVLYLQNARIYT